ncbi:MAG: hypothetical protein CL477_05585 [Acidobacteria bacterium]|jgi:hypothetical protein|nr:hypothetical protein [Acidobacteriota bacterium]MDP7338334.1 C13 family peptidase [Vicinamibacterales bacterium]MDP7480675.1 C13 family peptidase [Vicinamibacterales bacterium]HJN46590.1 C13 family peptidase [Vicinamibacterales bacterium]|tara:strand:- start:3593 stop:4630 length:1038 start_codon:yes stop_codon:yes gene_type:complete
MSRGVPPFVLLLMLSLLAAPVAAQQTHILVITGLSGDPAFAEEFHTWATTLLDAATDRYELPAENVTYLAEKTDADPARIDNRSTQENVEQAFADLAERAQPDDYVLVLLIGHGSYDRGESRFNLPGRDLTAKDYARLLEPLGSQQVAFVNAATASGGFIEALSGEGRTVVTATRSGGQWNATVFGGYFVEAFAGGEEESDQNKDGRVSVLEAFDYAAAEVARVYESDGRLQTEHALLDDNGDGEGSREPDPLESATDGAMARTVFISAGAGTGIAGLPDDPALRALYQERLEIQEQIEGLQATRGGTDEAIYQAEMEKLLVAMALKGREIREMEDSVAEPPREP